MIIKIGNKYSYECDMIVFININIITCEIILENGIQIDKTETNSTKR